MDDSQKTGSSLPERPHPLMIVCGRATHDGCFYQISRQSTPPNLKANDMARFCFVSRVLMSESRQSCYRHLPPSGRYSAAPNANWALIASSPERKCGIACKWEW